MTSAPKSARVCVQAGPATTRVKSTTTRPSRAVGTPVALGVRSGSCGLAVMIGSFLLVLFCNRRWSLRCDFRVYFNRSTSAAGVQLCRAPLKNKKARRPLGHRADCPFRNLQDLYTHEIPRQPLRDLYQYNVLGQPHGYCGW